VLNLILFSRALRVKKSFEKVLRDALFSFLKTKYFRVSNPNSSRTENIFSLSLSLGGGGTEEENKENRKRRRRRRRRRKRKNAQTQTNERTNGRTFVVQNVMSV
jgi:hypothetical protein